MTGDPGGPSPIARRVRELRLRRGLSQLRLAERVGRGPMWVDRLEQGDLEWVGRLDAGAVDALEVPVLADLAAALGVGIAEIAGGAEPPFPGPAPAAPAPPRRGPRATRVAAAAAGVGVATTGVALALLHVAAPPGGRGAPAPAVVSARLAPPPPVTLAPPVTPAPPAAAPAADPTPAPAVPAPPAPRRPEPATAVAVAVRTPGATPAPRPPGRVSVFPPAVAITVAAGSSSSPTVTFTVSVPNGGGAASVGAVTLDNPAVSILRDSCSRTTLAPGGICDITVRFGSARPGRYGGVLVVPVSGTATSVPIDVDVR